MSLSIRRILVFCLLCLFCLAAIYPLSSVPVWYDSHDRDSYFYLIQEFKGIFASGMLYPRWAPRLLAGYGYPSFVFYQPGVFFFFLHFTYLPLPLTSIFTVAIFCIFLISALGAYRLARIFGMDRFVSALCSSIYLFMPYAYVDVYIRGDLSEFFAMMLCPWVMVGIFLIRRDAAGPVRWSSLITYVLALSAVFLSHPHVSLFIIIIVAWFAVIDWIADGPRSRSAWLLAVGGIMAAVLTAPYWFTVLQLSSNIRLSNLVSPISQGMNWGELFYRTNTRIYPWWINTFGILSLFYIGLALIGLILVFPNRLFWQVFPLLFFSIYMNTQQSLPLWHTIPKSGYIQFVWRIASVSGLLQYIALLQTDKLRTRFSVGDYHLAMVFMIVLGIVLQPSVEFDGGTNRFVLRAFHYNRYLVPLMKIPTTSFMKPFKSIETAFVGTIKGRGEWDPVWLDKNVLLGCFTRHDDEPVTGSNAGLSVHVEKKLLPYRIRGTVDIDAGTFPATPGKIDTLPYIIINQVYFPGWAESIDNNPINITNTSDHEWANGHERKESPAARIGTYGRIQVFFPHPGHYEFDGYYAGPPHWQARNLMMCLSMLALCRISIRCRLVKPLPRI